MFTGIVETTGILTSIRTLHGNRDLIIQANFVSELQIGQSISHNGVCLSVTEIDPKGWYTVTAVGETLNKTNLGNLLVYDEINLERCLKVNDRLDGHIVQGHVDTTGILQEVEFVSGYWIMKISFEPRWAKYLISKGSICLNGISLTVVEAGDTYFTVAIIPITYQTTNCKHWLPGTKLNLEFDVIAKYIERMFTQ